MPVPINCPGCQQNYTLTEKHFGKRVRCSRCQTVFQAPSARVLSAELADTQVQGHNDGEDIFSGDHAPGERSGPLSMGGFAVKPPRSVTLGDFQVLRKLGAGNMGAVYLARQHSENRPVALKVLFRHLALQPLFVERFHQEARSMALLDHPGIVRIFGKARANDFHCIVMEFIDGFSASLLQNKVGGRFSLGDALFIILRVAEALEHAHNHHVIHRDVKPGNILINQLGHIKLTDLGLAKPLNENLSLTDTGLGVGTPHYMAPEQATNAKQVDHRCDIYGLGICLYEFLTGRQPFEAESAQQLLQAKERGQFPPAHRINAEVPPQLDRILDCMLSRDLRYRYPNCGKLITDLRSLGIAREHLGFNVLRVTGILRPELELPATRDRMEIVLVHDDMAEVRLAQQGLYDFPRPSNLTVVRNGPELMQYLRREEPYTQSPEPDVVLLSFALVGRSHGQIIRLLQANPKLAGVPMILVTGGGRQQPQDVLPALADVPANVLVCDLADSKLFQEVLQGNIG